MHRKLRLHLAWIVAVALLAPASAGAAPTFTDSLGMVMQPGTTFRTTSTNSITKTSLGTIGCVTFDITSTFTHNTGTTVRGASTFLGDATGCAWANKPITVTNFTLFELHSGFVGSGTVSITFEAHLPSNFTCHFEASALPFTYISGTDSIHFGLADLKGTPAPCEPGTFSGDWTLEADEPLGPITLD